MARLNVEQVGEDIHITVTFVVKPGQTKARQSKASKAAKRPTGERTFLIDTLTISPRQYNALHALLGNEPVIGRVPNFALGLSASLYLSEKALDGADAARLMARKTNKDNKGNKAKSK